jgi:hypothetical protein
MESFNIDIEFEGISKNLLLQRLNQAGIMLNEYAKVIFAHELFQTLEMKKTITVKKVSIEALGFPQGATNAEISARINEIGLTECPLEAAAWLRIQLTDQQELSNSLSTKNQSPLDALTVFSKPVIDDDDFPKRFYLRKMEGTLWLRGYTCSNDYVWKPSDQMIFMVSEVIQ